MSLSLTLRGRQSKPSISRRAHKAVATLSRAAATRLTWCVAAMQGAVLLSFALVPARMPPNLPLMDLLWASSRRPQFYPLVALLIAGPVLSVLAWQVRGWHRLTLAICWTAFIFAVLTYHSDRIRLMLRVLANQYL